MVLDAGASGKPVTAENGSLHAGFLVYIDGKDFAFFSVQKNGQAVFSRPPSKPEKHDLKKMLYGEKSLRCVPGKNEKDECVLFFHR